MYDLNLDVNDFPKKAATLEGNHLLSHVNGSSDLQQIDLDLSPLTLGGCKSHLFNGWEEAAPSSQDVQRLHATPNLSKLIRVRSPERCQLASPTPASQATAPTSKTREEASEPKCSTGSNGKVKKGKKQQHECLPEQQNTKVLKAALANELHKSKETQTKAPGLGTSSKLGSKQASQSQPSSVETHRVLGKRSEESKVPAQNSGGALSTVGSRPPEKSDVEMHGSKLHRMDQESEGKGASVTAVGLQQPRGKGRKNKNKTDRSSSSIGKVSLNITEYRVKKTWQIIVLPVVMKLCFTRWQHCAILFIIPSG